MSDGMFLSACRQVSKDFPDVTYDEDLLDRVCLHVRAPCLVLVHRLTIAVDCAKPATLFGPRHGDAQPLW